ncbi:hypothetical protein ACXC9Q_18765 [Kribbella sp. CWNU-51]
MSRAGGVFARLIDALYAASDASHRARGWEVRQGAWGARRYRLDARAWLEAQRRVEAFGSNPRPSDRGRRELVPAAACVPRPDRRNRAPRSQERGVMGAPVVARVLAVLFALCAGLPLAMVAGIDLGARHAVFRLLALLVVTMQIGETAWRFVWAAEDGERLLSYLPALMLAAGVPMAVAAHTDHTGLAVAIGGSVSSVLAATLAIRFADRSASQAVQS